MLLDPFDHFAFVVGLAEIDGVAGRFGGLATERLDIGERRAAVNLRLALAEQVEVGSVEDEDRAGHVTQTPCALAALGQLAAQGNPRRVP